MAHQLAMLVIQIEGLQQQLSQAISGRRMAEADALRRGATLKQLEHRLGQLSSEKDVSVLFAWQQQCMHNHTIAASAQNLN